MFSSGSAIVYIWTSSPNPDLGATPFPSPDIIIDPSQQNLPLSISLSQNTYEVLTDDSSAPSSYRQTGFSFEANLSLFGDLELLSLGLISTPLFTSIGKRSQLSQSPSLPFNQCAILIVPYPIVDSEQWRDSSILVSNCQVRLPDTSIKFGISEQRSFNILFSSTSSSNLTFGLGDWNIQDEDFTFILLESNNPSLLAFEE